MIKQVRANYDAASIEKDVQNFWETENVYQKTKELREEGERFYFVDGPPYTTGAIHLGTAMNKILKDVMIRYWRMNGFNVRDQPGYDMHGLPIEVQVEKKIGVRSKKEIEEYGIDKFVDICKNYAQELLTSMTEQFKQLGVWMNWDDPYRTLKPNYLEAAWWTLSEAYKKRLLVTADRVLTWCPRCETALAEAEIEYWDEDDPSVIVEFPVKDSDHSLLIWTTTPWTLPSNMAVAAHPELDYVKVRMISDNNEREFIVIETEAEKLAVKGGFKSIEIIERMKGKELEGIEYVPPFDVGSSLKRTEWTHKVVLADYVEAENTGLVHTAPGFGPDDYETGNKYGLYPFCPVNESGRFTDDFKMMAGQKVKTANPKIIEHLNEKGILFTSEKIKHRYGHCWRCKSPIIYRNTNQWFIRIPEIKEKMLEEIDRVKWVPDWAGSSRERNWVENARDWCISRQRYWGIPLPVWKCRCGEIKVVGKFSELKKGNGYKEGMDNHRPWIDDVTFPCPECGGVMHRVKDVLDVWFDSGVASWAQLGFPSDDAEMKKWWPGRFITEAHDQTRGWFYSQIAAGVISFDRAPFDEVLMHGWILDPKGQKMSKSKGNVIEPLDLIKEVGADSLRFYLLRANSPWEDTAFQKDGPKNARKVLNTFWNVVNFASTYMTIDRYDPEKHSMRSISKDLRNEDMWMISKTEKMKRDVTEGIETRNLHKMARALEEYILEDLSRWYVRLVRDRTWTEDSDAEKDKNASYFVLHHAIMSTAVAMSPLCPHISEEVYKHMGGKLLSVHMESWPGYDEKLINEDLETSMDIIQDLVEMIASERQKKNVKLRWPLKALMIRGKGNANELIRTFNDVLAQQANIKNISYMNENETPKGGDIVASELDIGTVYLDFEMTPEIEAEGYARELIRRIQQMRKDMKLDVEEYINCYVKAEPYLTELFSSWKEHIENETRARSVIFTDTPGGDDVKEWDIQGKNIIIGISSAADQAAASPRPA